MPWSAWQPGVAISGGVVTKGASRRRTVAGTDPYYDLVQVYSTSPSYLSENKNIYTPNYTQQNAAQYKAAGDVTLLRPRQPGPLFDGTLKKGIDFIQRPDRPADAPDAYVEYDTGANVISWPVFNINLDNISGTPAGNFRVKMLPEVRLPLVDGDYPNSIWGTIDADATTVLSGTPATPTGALGTITIPDGTLGFLLFIESDSTADSSAQVSWSGYIAPTVTTPQWRYWIPDAPTFPETGSTGVIRSMVVDCSAPDPVVSHHTKIASDLILQGSGEIPNSLRLPEFGRTVVCGHDVFSVFDNTGQKVIELLLNDGDNYLPGGLYSKPGDPTECAVVYDTGSIFVIQGLDATPHVAFVLSVHHEDYAWLTFSTDPYRTSHGLLNADFNGAPGDLGIYWRPIHGGGPDVPVGSITTWYDDPAGSARFGPSKVLHQYIGASPIGADVDNAMVVLLTDYRDPANLRVIQLTYAPHAVIPNAVAGDYSVDWLLAGSHTLAADPARGNILSAWTTLSQDPDDTTTVPGVTITRPNRYSVIVSRIIGPAASPTETGEIVDLAP